MNIVQRFITTTTTNINKNQITNIIVRNYTIRKKGYESTSISNQPNYKIQCNSIGLFESVFLVKNGTPRQGSLAPTSKGKIKINCKNADDALKGLEDYSHVWVLFWFHKNDPSKLVINNKESPSNEESTTTTNNIIELSPIKRNSTMVKPPRLNGKKTGLFSTRSPHRYNDIGLSLCKLDKIEIDTLYLSGVDIINGTPILDIKPYVPQYDSVPNATVPSWVEDQKTDIESVEFTSDAITCISNCLKTVGLKLLNENNENDHSGDSDQQKIDKIQKLITDVLKSEIRSTYRKKSKPDEKWGFFIDTLNIQCSMTSPGILTVFNIEDRNLFLDRKFGNSGTTTTTTDNK